MDNNQNTNEQNRRQHQGGEQSGNKKPFHGKRRPHHKRHNHRPNHTDKENLLPNDAVATEENPSELKEQATQQANDAQIANQQKKKPNRPQGESKKSQEETATNGRAQSAADNTSAKNSRPSKTSTGRPSRGTVSPKKQQSLPQMDNLLIDDCPEEQNNLSADEINADEIERILAGNIFEKPMDSIIPSPLPEGKVVVTGIRFRTGGKTYFFDPGNIPCTAGQFAVVETARGLEFGEVCISNRMIDESLVVPPLRPVIRIATPADIDQNQQNHEKEEEAVRIGKEKIAEHKLDMKLVSVQYTFDCSKLLFYFTSEGRVDFRELVKDLAGVFRIRIELRQIGIRDEARMLGGLGACGRALCCSTFLSDFGQVSMKMAKDQGLALNSTKISGCCGRLMCCLRYEYETYLALGRELPSPGTFVETPDGPGVVTDIFPLEAQVKVSLKGDNASAPKKYKKCDISLQHRAPAREQVPAEELSEPDAEA